MLRRPRVPGRLSGARRVRATLKRERRFRLRQNGGRQRLVLRRKGRSDHRHGDDHFLWLARQLAAGQPNRASGHSQTRRRRRYVLQSYDVCDRARQQCKTIPYGIKLYVPFIKQYFVREDLCASSGPKRGSGSNGCHKLWFDLWIGGTAKSNKHSVIACERAFTPERQGRRHPLAGDGMPVGHPGPIYRNQPPPDGTCD